MKERPILFSAPMVCAILTGQKTQTRRVLKNAPPEAEWFSVYHYPSDECRDKDTQRFYAGAAGALTSFAAPCPYGQPGDRLWVRETWQHTNSPYGHYEPGCACFYRADYFDDPHGMDGEKSPEGKYRTWIPSIHMPREVSRIKLEVVRVRVERLQAINHVDCIAEGAPGGHGSIPGYPYAATPHEHYRHIWESINGCGSWDENPWVWVVEFKPVESPKGGDCK